MKCANCELDFKDVLHHIKLNGKCQNAYDMNALLNERKLARIEKRKQTNRNNYERNVEHIKNRNKEYYQENKEARNQYLKENKNAILYVKYQQTVKVK